METTLATAILGQSTTVYVILTAIFALCAWLSGSGMAQGWRGWDITLFYAVLIALGHRFLCWGLRGAELTSLVGLLVSVAMFIAIAAIAYRSTLAARMVSQYPWLYVRSGPFGWKDKTG